MKHLRFKNIYIYIEKTIKIFEKTIKIISRYNFPPTLEE
jgi:hypothetical protein